MANIWAEVLGLERVGIHDNFFELGGHSLLATQVVSRVRQAFDVDLPLRTLFESPVIAELAVKLETARAERRGVLALPLVAVARDRLSPLSYAQQRLWFLDQLEPGCVTYNIPGAVRLGGNLDRIALERAINEIVRRHEVLRTTFSIQDGQPVQVIGPDLQLEIPVVDLTGLSQADREKEIQRRVAKEAKRPFNLAVWPLGRVTLLDMGLSPLTGEHECVLLFVLHHIISERWSANILVSEFTTLYKAFAQGKASPLLELPIQYADYAVWQRQWLQGEVLERQLAYWKAQLEGMPAVLELPTDRPRPVVQRHQGATYCFTVSHSLTEQLKALSRREGATLFMVLLAAFKVLLSRYSGQRDMCVGAPIANRTRVELEGLIGFFVNTLVLRTDLSGNPPFTKLLRRVQNVCLGAQEHQDLPFEKLVEELQPVRDMSHSPLFQVMVGLNNTPTRELEVAGLHVSTMAVHTGTTKFDLSLDLSEGCEGLGVIMEYNTEIFDSVRIERMAGHFQMVLCSIASKPDSLVGDLQFLTEPERRQLFVEWSAVEVEYPKDKCIHEIFEEQADRTPEAVAVVHEDRQLTYAELNVRANQLSHHLRAQGVGPDVLVGICMERSLEMVIGVLSILKAGGAYVPIDPSYPKERIALMVEDARPEVILTQVALRELLPRHARALCLDTEWEQIAERNQKNLGNVTDPHHLAYVIYTSGSTGRPKGVAVTHHNVRRLFAATESEYVFSAADVWTLFHSYAFDFSVWELWGALLYGGRLVVVPYWVSRSPEALHQLLREHGVTVLNQTPSSFYQLDSVDARAQGDERLALRLIMFGGEALEPRRLRGWFERHGDEWPRLVNMYGITETTVHVTWAPLGRADSEGVASTIGRPLPDLEAFILDVYGNPLPVGIPGELYIGGAGLARGYVNRPELTAERFIPNPFGEREGERLYTTGDLARYRSDGNIEYLGRIDHQVKIRGFRIELGEVEAALVRHPEVREAAVLAREDSPAEKRLVAYVVGDPPVPTVEELRGHLKERLPEYMVPSVFVFLDALPLTPNGKVDRKALPAPDVSEQLAHQHVAPRTPPEEILANIWAEVLGVDRIGIHDNFFELGGHSLLATQVVSRVRQAFDVDLLLRDLFNAPTVAALAQVLEKCVLAEIATLDESEAERVLKMGDLQPGVKQDHQPSLV